MKQQLGEQNTTLLTKHNTTMPEARQGRTMRLTDPNPESLV